MWFCGCNAATANDDMNHGPAVGHIARKRGRTNQLSSGVHLKITRGECYRQCLRVAPPYIRSGLETPSKSRANSSCRRVAAASVSRELRISALGSFRIGQLL
jgi:hypothetical protein